MKSGDTVLIIVHHFPFALVQIAGEYNYIKRKDRSLGLWFKHFRKVDNIRYYADFVKNANKWESITMTDTLSPLRKQNTESYKLIEEWLHSD